MSPKISATAQALISAHRSRQALSPPYDDLAPSDAEEAYAIQRAVWQAMVGDERPTVWKLAAGNAETGPVSAPVFPQRIASVSGSASQTLDAREFRLLGAEAEIALRFGRDLPIRTTPYSREEVLDAVASAHVAIETIDKRLHSPFNALCSLADNLVNGGFALGEPIEGWRKLKHDQLTARCYANGKLVSEAIGQAPHGDPFKLISWWANQGSLRYGGIKTDDVVTTGSWNGTAFVDMPVELRAEFVGLGSAVLRIM